MTPSSLAAAALAAVVAVPASAAPFSAAQQLAAERDPAAYTLDESSLLIERLGPAAATPAPAPASAGGSIPVIGLLLNTGAKVWKIVDANRPVADVRTQYATALPRSVEHWSQLQGWSAPHGSVYRLSAKNAYGVVVIDVRYQVLRVFGGSHAGKGRYLTAVSIEPLGVKAAWGYELTLEAAVPDSSVVNVGTAEQPVAAMMPQLRWLVRTPLSHRQGRSVYYVQGDGLYREVGGPFRRGDDEPVARAPQGALEYGP